MHRGNILVQRVKEKEAVFVINSRRYTVPTEGVRATIIDYTLSRVSKGKLIMLRFHWFFFNDTSNDFVARNQWYLYTQNIDIEHLHVPYQLQCNYAKSVILPV